VELVVECFDGVGVRPWLHVGAGGAQVCGESGEEVGFGGYVTEDTRCLVDVSSEYEGGAQWSDSDFIDTDLGCQIS
jgi:hypothetical protein